MKICIFGVGGVGGYFGALIGNNLHKEDSLYFVARGKHKEAICTNGLTLKKAGGSETILVKPKICTENIEELPVCDIIIVSIKSYDLAYSLKEIQKICHNNTIVLPLLNGVDIYQRIRKTLTVGVVLPSCVYVGTHIERPGVIYQKGGSCRISLGPDPLNQDYYPQDLLNLLKASHIDFDWEQNVQISIWTKYMFIAAYGLVTATYGKTIGEVLESDELSHLTKNIMQEIYSISQSQEIGLPSDIVETSYLKAKQFPFETKTSFHRDVEFKGNINEGDLFGGTLMRYGDKAGISIPFIKGTYGEFLARFPN